MAQDFANNRFIEKIGARLLFSQTAHHAEQGLLILLHRRTKNDARQITLRSVLSIWLRARSSRSGGSRRYQRHCRRENTRRRGADPSSEDRSGKVRRRRRQGGGRPCLARKYERGGGKSRRRLPRGPLRRQSETGIRL